MDGIIFDVDGTLWDSTEIVARAWNEYLKSENMELSLTADTLKGLFGQLLPDIARKVFPGFPEEEQMRLIDGCTEAEHQALLRQCAPVYPEFEIVLAKLSARFPLFIVSNCQAGYIELFLEMAGFGNYFKGHLCPGDTGEAKAENIMRIVKEYHLSSPVYVGDTLGDYNACQKAGVPFVFASYGFGQVDTPQYLIKKPADLLDLCLAKA